ncbi:MAG TPA: RNA polymerase sigma factor [Polyangiaceae bacterium]|nr:RNA polymerase sigma factor [Polyangiaceae bacterium]
MGPSAGQVKAPPYEAPRPDFRSIFDREFSYVWTSLRRLGVAPRDLEDVTHDVFVEVFRNLARYDATRPLRPWLFAFAFRFASDYRRLARHRVEVYEEPAGASADPPADDVVAARELRAVIMKALDSIELLRRGVFILHELDARPMAEIAETLGIPLNTAYSRLRVAREEFTTTFRLLQRGAT